jgi:hypothetical protein
VRKSTQQTITTQVSSSFNNSINTINTKVVLFLTITGEIGQFKQSRTSEEYHKFILRLTDHCKKELEMSQNIILSDGLKVLLMTSEFGEYPELAQIISKVLITKNEIETTDHHLSMSQSISFVDFSLHRDCYGTNENGGLYNGWLTYNDQNIVLFSKQSFCEINSNQDKLEMFYHMLGFSSIGFELYSRFVGYVFSDAMDNFELVSYDVVDE